MKTSNCNRRDFLLRSLGCSICLTSTSFISGVLAGEKDKSKEEIFNELDQKVEELMPVYGDCARTCFAVLNEQFRLKAKKLIRGLKPFPGIASRGETCGAVSGCLLAIGLYFEPSGKSKSPQPTETMQHANYFYDAFVKEFGSAMCKGVQEHQYGRSYNLRDQKERVEFMQVASSGKCREVVKKAVRIAGEILIENA
jgi:C_GCAxxG_C_C family probable redox protein